MKNQGLELVNTGKLSLAGFEAEKRGVTVPPGTDLEKFSRVWQGLNGASEFVKYARADLASYAEGELNLSLAELAKSCGEDLTSLSQSVRAVRRVPLSRRSEKLIFKHTEAIAELEDKTEQMEFSLKAEENGWTPAELREAIRKHKGEQSESQTTEPQPSANLPFPHLNQVKNYIARTPQAFFEEPGVCQRWKAELKPLIEFYELLETIDGQSV